MLRPRLVTAIPDHSLPLVPPWPQHKLVPSSCHAIRWRRDRCRREQAPHPSRDTGQPSHATLTLFYFSSISVLKAKAPAGIFVNESRHENEVVIVHSSLNERVTASRIDWIMSFVISCVLIEKAGCKRVLILLC